MKNYLLLLIPILFISSVYGQERITSYDVKISVQEDRSIRVTETLEVNVEGFVFQRGIYRDIINVLRDDDGDLYRYKLDVEEVKRNGEPEPFTTISQKNYKTIRIGRSDYYLPKGFHTYEITYTMRSQVRFFETYDEMYWNAIGGYWDVGIDKSTVTVQLPDQAEIRQINVYCGREGSKSCDAEILQLSDNVATMITYTRLGEGSGMTVSVTWDKGIIQPPTQAELDADREYVVDEIRLGMYILYVGTGLVFIYYLVIWFIVGVDPKKGPVFPRWDVPQNLSPGAARYILEMGYDNKVFTSEIIDMAVKRHVDIEKHIDYTLTKKKGEGAAPLKENQKIIKDKLFVDSDSLRVDNTNHTTFGNALSAYRKDLKRNYKKQYFTQNYIWLLPGVLMTIGAMFAAMSNMGDSLFPAYILLGTLFFLFLFVAIRSNNSALRLAMLVFAGFMCIPMTVLYLFEDFALTQLWPFLPACLTLAVVNQIFYQLLPAPTLEGRKLMDELEGLKMYMETAEKNRMSSLNPPEENLQLFEKLFPYALALGVEQAWSERFSNLLEQTQYKPDWYQGDFRAGHIAAFSTTMGSSFASSLSSASAPPQSSSSSGSSGGGFSGGGGGGGGGGGW